MRNTIWKKKLYNADAMVGNGKICNIQYKVFGMKLEMQKGLRVI
jgi:hypothetical protein